ncbi:hypothetical protein ACFPM3_04135 [Streptomyces coeruleoprunus]|uniref:Uncharacterized protein n=1 Tax=Streptomyces coeruleoprunus TaxID=285563 RepID=A0ABV9X931_9ACTN
MDSRPVDSFRGRTSAYLRKWARRHGRSVHAQVIRGAAYSLGSGAVSVIILWIQTRF